MQKISPHEINTLLALFSDERYAEAAILAKTMTVRFPLHEFGWKALGAVFKQMGQSADALAPMQKAVALAPADAEAHYNLGSTLGDLGRLDEAEASYRRAAQVRPNFAEAHHNLGSTLKDLGRLDEAEASYRQALQIKPDYVEAHINLGVTLRDLGRLDEAEVSYRRALQIKPDYAEAHYNLGATLGDFGRREEAEASFRRAVQIKPSFTQAHYNLGVALIQLGRADEAEACFRQAVQIKPDYAEAHCDLGSTLKDLGRLDEAEASYRQALKIKPDYAEAHINLGNALNQLRRLDQAEASYRRALEIKPNYAEAHCYLGNTLQELGRLDEALSHYRIALGVSPSLLAARQGMSLALSNLVPLWHVPMMNEQRRNNAYFAALKSAITPDSVIFEIGTGSGLLAMMAAKLGAKRVATCEAVPLIAETAQRIITDNGYEKFIKIISKRSVNIKVGEDLPQKADILVSEIFSGELLGEHVLPSIEDAKRRLLKPRGRVIPAAGSIMIALFGGNDIGRNLVVENSFGFNLQHFNSVVSEKQPIARDDLIVEMLTDGIEAFRFDFENNSFFPSQRKSLRIPIRTPGRCYGVIQWIRLQMDRETVFENHPSEKSAVSNWQRCTYIFPESIEVKLGQVVFVSASHNRVVPWFVLDRIESA